MQDKYYMIIIFLMLKIIYKFRYNYVVHVKYITFLLCDKKI